MAFTEAVDWFLQSGMTLEEYAKMVGIEQSSTEYAFLQEAINSRDIYTEFNRGLQYKEIKDVLADAPTQAAFKERIDILNLKLKSNPDVASAAKEVLGDQSIKTIHSIDGSTMEFYTPGYSNPSTALAPSGGVSSEIASGNIALNAEVIDGNVQLAAEAGKTTSGLSVKGLVGAVSNALTAVSIITIIGKVLSGPFYEANKSLFGNDLYWSDPDFWSSMYSGDTSFKAFIMNNLFFLDPVTNEITMGIDDRFTAALVGYLTKKGWFNQNNTTYTRQEGSTVSIEGLNYPLHAYDDLSEIYTIQGTQPMRIASRYYGGSGKFIFAKADGVTPDFYYVYYVSKIDDGSNLICDTNTYVTDVQDQPKYPATHETSRDVLGVDGHFHNIINGKDVYGWIVKSFPNLDVANNYSEYYVSDNKNQNLARAAFFVLYGVSSTISTIGLVNQTNANVFTVPRDDLTNEEILELLQARYPELWEDVITRGVLQEDGTVVKRNYIKSPIPNGSSYTSPEPTTGTTTQKDTKTNYNDLPSHTKDQWPSSVGKPSNPTKTPDDTDFGKTPGSPLPTGSASSLWAVYNPSQSELDSFGAWMWSSDLFEQIKKIFNDPMQAVIGVHKIFAPPPVAGRRNIKVGYLDTAVNSNYVGSQYVEVNCGTVSLYEYFGNVFDYSPYTTVGLYLPFVGVVQLDVADVMRSDITVTYGVDVLTGDCLAKVSVSRDGSGGIIYSFPGNCAVKYPISSGSYMSIVGYAMGAAATMFTGNIGMFGPVSNIFGSRPTVQHSGAFTGNSGATGPKKPYLIVSRPQTATALNFNVTEGYPVNSTVRIGDCVGYIRVKELHLSNINATDEELSMIDQLLKEGVIVQS